MLMTSEDDPDDWFLLARDRLAAADDVFAARGATYAGVELLHEATERFLKGYLISRGWRLERTHYLDVLVDEAATHDQRFESFMDLAEDLTQQFFAQHYPGSDLSDVGANYATLRARIAELIALIESAYKDIAQSHTDEPKETDSDS
jgi:HEPN domain-containing protein